MIPFLLAAGIGALIGGGTAYALSSKEKEQLKKQVTQLEESHHELDERLRQATSREVQHRIEALRLNLCWAQERFTGLINSSMPASISHLERVYSVGKALELIIDALPKDGILDEETRQFVEVLTKVRSGEPLGKVDQARIEEYLDKHIGDVRRDFLEDRLANQYKADAKKIKMLLQEKDQKEIEIITLQRRSTIEGISSAGLGAMRARVLKIDNEVEELQQSLDDKERCLVVLTRVSRPDEAQEHDDNVALEIVQLLSQGERLTPEESQFLDYYRERYFRSAREILKRERDIDLIFQQEVEA